MRKRIPGTSAKWELTRSDERVDVYATLYRPRPMIELPISDSEWSKVKQKLHERLRKHPTKFAYTRLNILIEDGLYQVTFDKDRIDKKSGLIVEEISSRTTPRNRAGVFTEDEFFNSLAETIRNLEVATSEIKGGVERECYIRTFTIVAHNGFWEKNPRNVNTPNKKRVGIGRRWGGGLAKKSGRGT